jgi:hypothetical protein
LSVISFQFGREEGRFTAEDTESTEKKAQEDIRYQRSDIRKQEEEFKSSRVEAWKKTPLRASRGFQIVKGRWWWIGLTGLKTRRYEEEAGLQGEENPRAGRMPALQRRGRAMW